MRAPDGVYQASQIKRGRATKAEMLQRREALIDIVAEMQPMTVRQVFYQASVRGIVEKTEAGYAKVQTDLVWLRRNDALPYDWLADNTRWQRKPRTYVGVQQAIEHTAAFYRKALWADADSYVEVWLEKDALAGVVLPITALYDVPLMVTRGYASLSFLHSAAEFINEQSIPTYIYHFGDFDPSGVNAGEKIEETLRELAPNAEIYFERVAVTEEQIEEWNLPTRPTRSRIRGRRHSATSRSSSTRSRLMTCAPWSNRSSTGTCLRTSCGFSKPQRKAKGRCSRRSPDRWEVSHDPPGSRLG